jgi:hypothetical protein
VNLFKKSKNKARNTRGDYYATKTFTYFVPAPPARDTGYREKEFDKLFFELMKSGHEVISINTESTNGGMWIVCLLGAVTEEAAKLNLDFDYHFGLEQTSEHQEIVFES